ncbi:hypothetical protein ACET98_14415 [Aeromonas veronii]
MMMMPNADEITTYMHDALYALSGMIAIAGVCAGIIKRDPLAVVGGFVPVIFVLIALKGFLAAVVAAVVITLALMVIAFALYLVLVHTQPESEADHDGGGESQRNDLPTIDTLRGGAAFNQVADQMWRMTPEQRDEFIATTPRGGQPVIVSASSAVPKVLDDGADAVQPGKRKVILD